MDERAATELVVSLYRSLYPTVVRHATRVTGNVGLAEEIVQEAFMRLYRSLIAGKRVENPKAWVFSVVRREARKNSGLGGLAYPLEVLEQTPIGYWGEQAPNLERDQVTRLLSPLTCREEEVLILRVGGLKYREIAQELHISVKTVATLLARALRKLRAATEAEAHGEERIWPKLDARCARTLQ